jgi:hypothetical protein
MYRKVQTCGYGTRGFRLTEDMHVMPHRYARQERGVAPYPDADLRVVAEHGRCRGMARHSSHRSTQLRGAARFKLEPTITGQTSNTCPPPTSAFSSDLISQLIRHSAVAADWRLSAHDEHKVAAQEQVAALGWLLDESQP